MASFLDYIQPIISPQDLLQARQFIDSHTRFVVSAHLSPDGDALGAALAMRQYLQAKGKEARVVLNDAPGENLSFIPEYRSGVWVYDNQNDGTPSQKDDVLAALAWADALVGVDFNTPSRLGGMAEAWMSRPVPKLLLDHHLDPDTQHFDICLSYPEQSASCELVYRFILEMGDDALLNKSIATSLFCGMMTDTGWFVFNSNRPDFHLIMARLMQEGVDRETIIKESHVVPERKKRMEGFLLQQKLHIDRANRAACMTLSLAEMRRYGHQKGDSEGFVNIPLDIEGVEVSAFFREEKNFVKVSLRSKGNYPVNKIAERFFGGGGHLNAAGGEYFGSLASAENIFFRVVPLYKQYLSQPS